MPRNGSGVYARPPGIDAIPDQTIESVDYNVNVADVEQDLNTARPVIAGGTGANNATAARANLQTERSMQVVTNYSSHVWEVGSFYSSNVTGQQAPVDGHAFAGIVYGPDANNLVVEARDLDDTSTPGTVWVREKKAGVWEPAGWSETVVVSDGVIEDDITIDGGNIVISNTNPILVLDKEASGEASQISGSMGGLARWSILLGDDTPETGANAGSNFAIKRANDAGVQIDTPMTINRASGNVAVKDRLSVGPLAVPATAQPGTTVMPYPSVRHQGWVNFNTYQDGADLKALETGAVGRMILSDLGVNIAWGPSVAAGAVAPLTMGAVLRSDGYWQCQTGIMFHAAYTDFQVYVESARYERLQFETSYFFQYDRDTGLLQWVANGGQALAIDSGSNATFNQTCTANQFTSNTAIYANAGYGFQVTGYTGTSPNLFCQVLVANPNHSNMLVLARHSVGNWIGWDFSHANGAYILRENAFKTGGGVWADASDARIKTVLGDYTNGLDAILALRPVRYKFNANDTLGPPKHSRDGETLEHEPKNAPAVPYPNSPHHADAVAGVERIGLIAQEAEVPMPEMVSQSSGYIDGAPVTDLRNMDTSALVFALVNAVKTLAARVEALEAGAP